MEPLDPELSAREGFKPEVFTVASTDDEIARISTMITALTESASTDFPPVCIASCDSLFATDTGLLQLRKSFLESGISTQILNRDATISHSTIYLSHMSTMKGLEFGTVFIIHANDNTIPYPGAPESERWRDARKLYVAMTRARDTLFFSYSGQPSQFIVAMGESLQWHDKPTSQPKILDVESDLEEQLEKLRMENEKLKQGSRIYMKVGEKGGVSVYGLGKFPVTLYKQQWLRLIEEKESITAFIEQNSSSLSSKTK